MNIGRTLVNTILASFAGSMAGGAAGGAALALVMNFPDLSNAVSPYAAAGGLLIYLWGASIGAFLGIVGGVMFGSLPTLLLGSILSFVRNLPPFRHLAIWAFAGALAGIAYYVWMPFGSPSATHDRSAWASAWAVGGATSMMVYWAGGIGRNFAPNVAR